MALPPLKIKTDIGCLLSYKEARRIRFLEKEKSIRDKRQAIGREVRANESKHALVIQNNWRGKKERETVSSLVKKLVLEHREKKRLEEEKEKLIVLAEERRKWIQKIDSMPESIIKELLRTLEPNSPFKIELKNGWPRAQEGAVFKTLKFFNAATHIIFASCILKGKTSELFASSIIRQVNLQVLKLDSCEISAREGTKIMNGLLYCKHIKELCFPSNYLIRGRLLKTNIHGNPVFEENLEGISSIAQGVKRFKNIKHLDLKHNLIGANGVATLLLEAGLSSKSSTLRVIDFTGSVFGIKGSIILSQILLACPTLEELLIGYNDLVLESLLCFIEALIHHPNLKKLGLEGNKFNHETADHIVAILKSNPRITSLNLSKNELGSRGIAEICQSICYFDNIQWLSLAYNNTKIPSVSRTDRLRDLRGVADMIGKTKTLRYLDLSHVSLVGLLIAQPVCPKRELRMTHEPFELIVDALEFNSSIREIRLQDSNLQYSRYGEHVVQRALMKRKTVFVDYKMQRFIAFICFKLFPKASSIDERKRLESCIVRIITFAAPRRTIII